MEAFELGGDFHSRTAYGMYDEIQREVKEGVACGANCMLHCCGLLQAAHDYLPKLHNGEKTLGAMVANMYVYMHTH